MDDTCYRCGKPAVCKNLIARVGHMTTVSNSDHSDVKHEIIQTWVDTPMCESCQNALVEYLNGEQNEIRGY